MSELIRAGDLADETRVITGRHATVAKAFEHEKPTLLSTPAELFDPARLLTARVDSRARVSVRQSFYSVPVRFAGRRLTVRLSASVVQILDGSAIVAQHERAAGRLTESLILDHYLEVLRVKPGALPGATALVQGRRSGAFTASHQRYWDAVRAVKGDAAGTRALIEILLAHRSSTAAVLVRAMDRAVAGLVLDPAAVIIDARTHVADRLAPVVPIGALSRYDRPAPTLTAYDQLLTGSRP